MKKKDMIAMLLAGGQGSRLGVLTKDVAKPAVPFGGKYRIIDFPLSNCINSDIDTIGVLTQYQPMELNAYIGNGQPWDLDRMYGGARILPPYVRGKEGEWYKGTANAIYQNIPFIEQYSPNYVIILSGDHVYKMNYRWMLDQHMKKDADCTIAVIEVPMEEASRFGVMNTNENLRITEFEEKPAIPKSNLASMGVYIFNWPTLKEYLIRDEEDPESSKDFGKNVIPAMLNDNKRLYAYKYLGYWKDVGTIESLWEANMDLLKEKVSLELYDPRWKIYARNGNLPPQYIGHQARMRESHVSEGCSIEGTVENSIIFPNVTIKKGAVVRHSVVMSSTTVEENAEVHYAIIAEGVTVGAKAEIGANPEKDVIPAISVVADRVNISCGTRIDAGTVVDRDL
ncbi:MAG: glucose-1-phosphate adenylyltransferase [Eubacteriales bacterium]|nr:glucose-1-phosphate adenylyltransferase [Eubacteriales bacterium]MDD3863845.1 glucose-1-phosphate adenylyltransferase [Eubacteriales bacterium]